MIIEINKTIFTSKTKIDLGLDEILKIECYPEFSVFKHFLHRKVGVNKDDEARKIYKNEKKN